MFYLIESIDQYREFENSLEYNNHHYVEYIVCNNNTHPALAEIIAIYIKPFNGKKGYILPLKHPDCINLSAKAAANILSKFKSMVVRDKKECMHLLPFEENKYIDLQHIYYLQNNKPFPNNFNTQAHTYFYRKFPQAKVNKIIPIGKHYESCEKRSRVLLQLFQTYNVNIEGIYNKLILPNLYHIEKNPMRVNKQLDNFFKLKNKRYSIVEDKIFGWYNPYTTTGRPVNNFNGINFVGLKHNNGERNCFIPENDYFLEIDYDGYHPRLIGNLIGYKFKQNVHEELGHFYFNTKQLTKPLIKESKIKTFKQIYGGIKKENLFHPFFKHTQTYINKQWDHFNKQGYVETSGGKKIYKKNHENINKQKLFNYLIQSIETETNIEIIGLINNYLKDKDTKLVLYVYDAFIFDISRKDGKNIVKDLKKIISKEYPIKLKAGGTYGDMVALS
tara:strand:- start:269 stop:1606 length:1338 start_codon:yes stop_codon:yes gene_type:complete